MNVATYAAFKDELEKLAKKEGWTQAEKDEAVRRTMRYQVLPGAVGGVLGGPGGIIVGQGMGTLFHKGTKGHWHWQKPPKEKRSSLGLAGAEVAGLGILARPSWQKLRQKGSTAEEKSHSKHELAGLGVLAAHPAYELGKAGLGALRKIKKGSADGELVGGALSLFKTAQGVGQVMGSFGAGTGKMLADTTRRAAAGGGVPLAQRVAERAAKMKMIAHKANPVRTLPSSGKVIHASINKEAFLGKLLGTAKPAVKAAFKPSFAGHAKALGVGTNVAKSGVETVKSFNPLTQTMSKSKSISIPGLR